VYRLHIETVLSLFFYNKTLLYLLIVLWKYEDLIKLNYDEKKVKIKNIFQSWSKRSLTLFGKVTIIKSLIVPQLTYLLSVLPNPGQ
jgi:hypothetical protein